MRISDWSSDVCSSDLRYREGLGSAVIYQALASGDIDVYVDYSGTLWTNRMHRADVPPRPRIVQLVGAWTRRTDGVRLLGALGSRTPMPSRCAATMRGRAVSSEEHTSELPSLLRTS